MDVMVRIANVIARYNGRVQIKSISFLYHLFFIVISVVFAVRVSRKKPGTHNAEKPKGIDNTIFHVGIFIVRMRQILAYVLEINRPVKYSNANVSMLNKISVCVVGNNNSVSTIVGFANNEYVIIKNKTDKANRVMVFIATNVCRDILSWGSRMAMVVPHIITVRNEIAKMFIA